MNKIRISGKVISEATITDSKLGKYNYAEIELSFDKDRIIDMYLSAENGETLYQMLVDYLQGKFQQSWKKGECKNCRWQGMYCIEPECHYEPICKGGIQKCKPIQPEQELSECRRLLIENDGRCPYCFKSQAIEKQPQPESKIEELGNYYYLQDGDNDKGKKLWDKVEELIRFINQGKK